MKGKEGDEVASTNYNANNYRQIEKTIHEALEYDQLIVLAIELLIDDEIKRYAGNDAEATIRAKYEPIISYAIKNSDLLRQIGRYVKET
jgi:hypothetical protein